MTDEENIEYIDRFYRDLILVDIHRDNLTFIQSIRGNINKYKSGEIEDASEVMRILKNIIKTVGPICNHNMLRLLPEEYEENNKKVQEVFDEIES